MYTIIRFNYYGSEVRVSEIPEAGWELAKNNYYYAGKDIYFDDQGTFIYLIKRNKAVTKDHQLFTYICGMPVYYTKFKNYLDDYIKQIGDCVIEYNISGYVSKINGLNVTYYSSSNIEKVGNVKSGHTW